MQEWSTGLHAKKEEVEMMDKCPHDKRNTKELDLRVQRDENSLQFKFLSL